MHTTAKSDAAKAARCWGPGSTGPEPTQGRDAPGDADGELDHELLDILAQQVLDACEADFHIFECAEDYFAEVYHD